MRGSLTPGLSLRGVALGVTELGEVNFLSIVGVTL